MRYTYRDWMHSGYAFSQFEDVKLPRRPAGRKRCIRRLFAIWGSMPRFQNNNGGKTKMAKEKLSLDDYKKSMSKKRKEWLKEHPNLHPWRNNNVI